MSELTGNCLVAQSGGPTAVINASVAGVVSEALNHECIEEIYGGLNGVHGILNEELIDLAEESQQNIRGLRVPGIRPRYLQIQITSRRGLRTNSRGLRNTIFASFSTLVVMILRIPLTKSQLAQSRGHEMRAIGIPDYHNDLVVTATV